MKLLLASVYCVMIMLCSTRRLTSCKLSLSHVNAISNSSFPRDPKEYKTLKDEVVFSGWRKIIRRDVFMPNGKTVSYDVVSQGCPSIIVFTWDTNTSTTTLIREYHPGVERVMYGVVAGMYEEKHDSPLQCAQFELEEEAQLSTEKWIPLLENEGTSVPFDKYSDNRFYPFLAIDCKQVENPRPMDDDENIELERHVTYRRLLELISQGKFNINSSYTILLALRKLQELGIKLEQSE